MKKTLPILIVLAVGLFLTGLIGGTWLIGTYNGASTLKNTYEMKVKDNSSHFDNTWKQISQVCQIADSKKDAFRQVFTEYANARTPEDAGKMFLWVKESAPNLDLKVYDNAQNIIVAARNTWTFKQTELVDIAREYNQKLVVFPGNIVLGMFGFTKIDPKVITSTRTEKAFEEGRDDDVSLVPSIKK